MTAKNKNEKVLKERLFLCFVAICLIWATSLPVAQVIVSRYSESHQIDQVRRNAQIAGSFAANESKTYTMCMGTREQQCVKFMRKSANWERKRSMLIQSRNENLVSKFERTAKECLLERQQVTTYLSDLQFNDKLNIADIRTNSTSERCFSIDALLSQEEAARKSVVTAASFSKSTGQTMEIMNSEFGARLEYDRSFVAKKQSVAASIAERLRDDASKMQDFLRDLSEQNRRFYECLKGSSSVGADDCTNVATTLRIAVKKSKEAYRDMARAYESINQKVSKVEEELQDFQKAYDAFIDRLAVRMVLWIANPPQLDVKGLLTRIFLDHVVPKETIEEFEREIDTNKRKVENAIDEAAEKHNEVVQAISGDQGNNTNSSSTIHGAMLDRLLHDYDPPPSGIPGAVEHYLEVKSKQFLSDMESTVKGLGELRKSIPSEFQKDFSLNSSAALRMVQTPNEAIKSFDPGEWSVYLYKTVSFDELYSRWTNLSGLALLFDFVFRCLRSAQIIHKYMRLSKVVSPPVDMREGRTSPVPAPRSMSSVQKLMYYIFHPAANAVLLGVFIWIAGSGFMAMYGPFLNEFRRGCVNAVLPHPGTFITRNAATMAMQYSTKEGAAIAAAAIDRLNAEASETCASSLADSRNILMAHIERLEIANQRYQLAKEDIDALHECLDLQQVGPYFAASIRASACRIDRRGSMELGSQALFDCNVIEPCDFGCLEPNRELLTHLTWKAGCEVEGTIHASLLSAVLSFVVFLIINVSRLLLVRGCRLFFWRSLSANQRYSFIADIGDESIDPNMIRERLEDELQNYRRSGMLSFICAFTLLTLLFLLLQKTQSLRS